MTEQEAKTKWCPIPKGWGTNCMASDCMWWQWMIVADKWGAQHLSSTEGHCGGVHAHNPLI